MERQKTKGKKRKGKTPTVLQFPRGRGDSRRNLSLIAKMNVTNPIAVHKVNQSPRRCNQEMTTSSYFVSLVSYADPSITHSSSNNSLISKLAYFSMDLYSKLSCWR